MEITEAQLTILTAADGKILTDGTRLARTVALPSPEAASLWREIDAPESEAETTFDPEAAAAEAPATYSKYRLHRLLDEAGVWDAVWAEIKKAGYDQYWNDCNELSEADPVFNAALLTLRQLVDTSQIALPSTIPEILKQARN